MSKQKKMISIGLLFRYTVLYDYLTMIKVCKSRSR